MRARSSDSPRSWNAARSLVSTISTATEAPSLHLSNSEQTHFARLVAYKRRIKWRDQSSMERPSKASVSWSTTVRTSRNALANFWPILLKVTAVRILPRKRRGCHEHCPACSDPTPDPRCDRRSARRRCRQQGGLPRNRIRSLPVGQREAASDPRGVAATRAWNRRSTIRLWQLVTNVEAVLGIWGMFIGACALPAPGRLAIFRKAHQALAAARPSPEF